MGLSPQNIPCHHKHKAQLGYQKLKLEASLWSSGETNTDTVCKPHDVCIHLGLNAG